MPQVVFDPEPSDQDERPDGGDDGHPGEGGRRPRREPRPGRRRHWAWSIGAVMAIALACVVSWQAIGRSVNVAPGPRTWTQAHRIDCASGRAVLVHTVQGAAPDEGSGELATDPVYVVEIRNAGRWPVTLSVPGQQSGTQAAFDTSLAPRAGSLDGRPTTVSSRVQVPAGRSALLRVTPPDPEVSSNASAAGAPVGDLTLRATTFGVVVDRQIRLPVTLIGATPGFGLTSPGADARQRVCVAAGA